MVNMDKIKVAVRLRPFNKREVEILKIKLKLNFIFNCFSD